MDNKHNPPRDQETKEIKAPNAIEDKKEEKEEPMVEIPPKEKRGLPLTIEEEEMISAWDIPSKPSWVQRLRDDEHYSKLIDYLEGREGKYKDLKEQNNIVKMAKNYAVQDGILVTKLPYEEDKNMRIVAIVPNGFRTSIMSENHDTPEAGHRSTDTTLANVRRYFWWKGMTADVTSFCSACILCAVIRSGHGRGLLVGWGVEPPRLACVHADFAGPLQTTRRGNRYVFALVDRATGWVEMHATQDCKSQTAANILLNQWVPRYGCPRVVVTDNGKHFSSQTFEEATRALGMRLRHTTTYHPQSNGMIERRFRDMGKAIKIFGKTNEWDETLPAFTLATRNTINKTIGYSPATLLLGEELRLPNAIDSKVELWHDQTTELEKFLAKRKQIDEIIQEKKRKQYEESEKLAQERFESIDWKVGQKVYVYVDRRALGQSKKEWIRWSGPFDIVEVRQTTLVLLRHGKNVTINQTKCILLKDLHIPDRDLKGRVIDREPSDKKEQEKITQEKVQKLAQKLKARKQRVSLSDSEDDSEDEVYDDAVTPEEEKLKQLARTRPERKEVYTLDDLKENSIVVVWAFEATRLAKFLFHRYVDEDKDPWIRLHLFESKQNLTEKHRIYWPIWKTGKRDVPAPAKRKGYSPFWVDVYLKDILYNVKNPLRAGKIDPKDSEEMGYGIQIQVLANTPNLF